jgi:trk system potassium uptake protein TrkH
MVRGEASARADRIARLLYRFAPALLVLTAVPMAVGFATGDGETGLSLLPGTLAAALLCFLTRRLPPPKDASEKEDALAVALAFPLGLLLSSAPYLLHGLSLLDAVFEGMSGVTATGLTRYGDIEAQPFGIHFLRAWQEWVGGYAIVTLTVALLPKGAKGAQEMAESDVADDRGKGGSKEPDLRARSALVTLVYVLFTIACVLLVWASGQSFGFSILHGLTSVSTGGFSAQNDSLASMPAAAVTILMLFSLLGAVALSEYVRPFTERAGLKKLGLTIGTLLLLSVLAAGAVAWIEGPDGPAFADVLQVAASAQTTTGFSALKVPELEAGSQAVLIASMFVGGDLGSTAGGIKLVRFVALGFALYALFRPQADLPGLPGDGAKGAWRLIRWWFGLTLAGWLLLLVAGHPPLASLFEFASALNNVGLSAGVSGGETPVLTRIVLILAMWLGRVEILAAVLLIRPILPRGLVGKR